MLFEEGTAAIIHEIEINEGHLDKVTKIALIGPEGQVLIGGSRGLALNRFSYGWVERHGERAWLLDADGRLPTESSTMYHEEIGLTTHVAHLSPGFYCLLRTNQPGSRLWLTHVAMTADGLEVRDLGQCQAGTQDFGTVKVDELSQAQEEAVRAFISAGRLPEQVTA